MALKRAASVGRASADAGDSWGWSCVLMASSEADLRPSCGGMGVASQLDARNAGRPQKYFMQRGLSMHSRGAQRRAHALHLGAELRRVVGGRILQQLEQSINRAAHGRRLAALF